MQGHLGSTSHWAGFMFYMTLPCRVWKSVLSVYAVEVKSNFSIHHQDNKFQHMHKSQLGSKNYFHLIIDIALEESLGSV
jgi:hypothetical protein